PPYHTRHRLSRAAPVRRDKEEQSWLDGSRALQAAAPDGRREAAREDGEWERGGGLQPNEQGRGRRVYPACGATLRNPPSHATRDELHRGGRNEGAPLSVAVREALLDLRLLGCFCLKTVSRVCFRRVQRFLSAVSCFFAWWVIVIDS